jgi:hypothetical protein
MTSEERLFLSKIDELSMLLMRMAIQNADYLKTEPSLLATSAIYAAIALLRTHKVYNNDKFYINFTRSLLITGKK